MTAYEDRQLVDLQPNAPLLLDALEVGAVCSALCRLLRFEELCALSSLCRRAAAISHTRINFFARAKLRVPTFRSDDELHAFFAGIRTDALLFIKALRVTTDVKTVVSSCGGPHLSFSSTPSSATWRALPRLETLDLSGLLTSDLSPSFWDQPHLKSLNLSSSIGVELDALPRLQTLEHLFLNNSLVGNKDLVHLSHLIALETLELSQCRFVDDLTQLLGLVNLRHLVLGDGDMGLRSFAGFDAFAKLRHFEHRGRRQGGRLLDLPLRAPDLEYCNVSQTRLRDAEFLRFSPKLEHLDLSGTGLRAGVPFASLERLRVLIVSTPLPQGREYYAPLASLPRLERVEVRVTASWQAAPVDLEAVRAVFPESVHPLLVVV